MQVKGLATAVAVAMTACGGQSATAQDAAALAQAFGAREQIQQISLSPDGRKVAIITPYGDHGEALMIAEPFTGGTPATILRTRGDPEQLGRCSWVTDARLACSIYTVQRDTGLLIGFSRMVAINADGSALKLLTAAQTSRALETAQNGGTVIDWLGDGSGNVMMTRVFTEQFTTGTLAARNATGLGVERVNTISLARRPVEDPRSMATEDRKSVV